jgi:hypothetical protein
MYEQQSEFSEAVRSAADALSNRIKKAAPTP